MGTLFSLVGLALLVWIGSIALMFVMFYVGMAALHYACWAQECRDDAYGSADSIVAWVLLLPNFLTVNVICIAVGYDWLINHTSAALLFWDRAREPMVTGRLERYKNSVDGQYGWRKRFAVLICTKCLDWADPSGRHCR